VGVSSLKPTKLHIDPPYPGTVISNGLADGGINVDGSIMLFWAESIGSTSHAHIWKGHLSLKEFSVKNVEIFVHYSQLSEGSIVYPDGANIIQINGIPAYAISVLGAGEIRAFHLETGQLIARLILPESIKNITKFSIGEDGTGKPALFVTTLDFNYPINTHKNEGGTFLFSLPHGVEAHIFSAQRAAYTLFK
jgi:hypothetical protein